MQQHLRHNAMAHILAKDMPFLAAVYFYRALHSLLTSEEYYQARVVDAIKTLDELDMHRTSDNGSLNSSSTSCTCTNSRVTQWPCAESVGGYKNLFHILVDLAPLEGWYTLCDAWPWGYLVLMKFCDGMFCGEVVSVSQDGSLLPPPPLPSDDGYDCQRKRIFEISLLILLEYQTAL